MLFDKLAKTAEHSDDKAMIKMLQQAHLFVFPYIPHEILKKEVYEDDISEFFLPFPCIAIEDEASCVIIQDSTPDQTGFNVKRHFIEIFSMCPDHPEAYRDSHQQFIRETINPADRNRFMVSIGTIKTFLYFNDKQYEVIGTINRIFLCEDGRINYEAPLRVVKSEHCMSTTLSNYVTALEEVLLFNRPDRFILEKTPLKVKKAGKGLPIKRSHQRPIYTLLKSHEIREKLGLPEPEHHHASPRPHERRAHWRTYRNERYKKMRGQSVKIPSTWVGPSEAELGKHYYRVILDR